MIKKFGLMVLGLLIIINCGKKSRQAISWSPVEPKYGEKIRITYNPQSNEANLVDVSQITIICQFYFNNTDSIFIVPMNKSNNIWQIEFVPPEGTFLISYKFEDDLSRTDDNNHRGWAIIIRDKNGSIVKNTHYYLGQIYRGKVRPDAFPYFQKAISEFEEEIKAYPRNYRAWYGKWEAELNIFESINPLISQKLDSLLSIDQDNIELLNLAFKTNLRMLQNTTKAIYFAELLMNSSPKPQNIDEIAYSMIFLKHSKDLQQQIAALEKFINEYPQSQLLASNYFRLGNYYLQLKAHEKAKLMFERLNQLVPNDIANTLILASMEIDNKNYLRAGQFLTNAKNYCTEDIIRSRNPWIHPGKRTKELTLNFCQIYSTTAKLNYAAGDFEEAIKNRKIVIELGTSFPAYEWKEIGKSYLELNNVEQAKKAFIKVLSINPYEKDAIQKLKILYINEQNTEAGFNNYIEKAIKEELKASAQPAPDFEAIDLNDKKFSLSDMGGKIIVLNFWDNGSTTCVKEIPQLNELVAAFKNINFIEFWAISIAQKSSINKFFKDINFDYHQFYNGAEISKLYHIIGFPTHLVIDSNGYIRYKYIGFTPNIKQKLQENIQFLLKESQIIS